MRDLDLHDPAYQPQRLLKRAAVAAGASSLSDLATRLGFAPAQVSRTIRRQQRLSADMVIAIMDATGWDLAKVRELAGLSQVFPAAVREGVPAPVPSALPAAFIDVPKVKSQRKPSRKPATAPAAQPKTEWWGGRVEA